MGAEKENIMTYFFKPQIPELENGKILNAGNGGVYVEEGKLHVVQDRYHFVYNDGWYMRHPDDGEDRYLGDGACPTAEYSVSDVVDADALAQITIEQAEDAEE